MTQDEDGPPWNRGGLFGCGESVGTTEKSRRGFGTADGHGWCGESTGVVGGVEDGRAVAEDGRRVGQEQVVVCWHSYHGAHRHGSANRTTQTSINSLLENLTRTGYG